MNYEQLYKYLNELYYSYFRHKTKISLQTKQDIIQDVLINLYEKEQQGKLSSKIEENKNYIFITFRNEIFERHKLKKYTHTEYREEIDENSIIFNPTTDNDMDKGIRHLELQNILKSNKFNHYERQLIDLTFKGYELQEIGEELQLDEKRIYAIHTNLKAKLKFKLNPTYKYLLKYNNGNTIGIKSQNELSRRTGMSKDKILLGFKLGKTKYKNYEIQIL